MNTLDFLMLLQAGVERLNAGGWTVMLLSIGSVLTLVTYCLTKVLSLPPIEQESVKGPLQTETPDAHDAD